MRSFCQDRLGTNTGKTQNKMPFSSPVITAGQQEGGGAGVVRVHGDGQLAEEAQRLLHRHGSR
jgi:hypothetical protein